MRKIIVMMVLCLTSVVQAEDQAFRYDSKGKRDPFWSLVSPSGVIMNYDTDLSVADLTLEGIISDPSGNNLAVINGKIIKVTDKVGFFTVSKIDKDKVTLIKDEEKFILELKREDKR